jgi:hypothetical protein
MISRRTGLLSLVAVLALALVGPAGAAAAEWKHEGAPLAGHTEMGLFGSQVFTTSAGSMICEVEATLTAEPGSSGSVTNFKTNKCMGLSGSMVGCTVIRSEQPAGAWPVHVNATDLTATKVTLLRTFNAGCPVKQIESTIPELTNLLVEPEAITEIEYFGNGSASVNGGPAGEYEVFGSWFVAGEASGTYGIG